MRSYLVIVVAMCTLAVGERAGWSQESRPLDREPRARRPAWRQPRWSAQGRVVRMKQEELRGDQSAELIVLLRTRTGRSLTVDLGSADQLRRVLRTGDEIDVYGPIIHVGGSDVLLAEEVTRNGRTTSISRRLWTEANIDSQTVRIQGIILERDPRRVYGSGGQNLVLRILPDQREEVYVDVGPASRLRGADLGVNEPVVIWGRNMLGDEQDVVLAFRILTNGVTYLIRPVSLQPAEERQRNRAEEQRNLERYQATNDSTAGVQRDLGRRGRLRSFPLEAIEDRLVGDDVYFDTGSRLAGYQDIYGVPAHYRDLDDLFSTGGETYFDEDEDLLAIPRESSSHTHWYDPILPPGEVLPVED